MSEKIVLYYHPMSRGRIVHWMLEEVGVDYETKLVALEKGEQKKPSFLAVNPMGKVPTLVHRNTVITEAPAICAYLADAFPEAKLAPRFDDPRRGTYLRWLFFAAGCVEPATTDKGYPRVKSPGPGQLGYGTYDDVMNTLETAITPGPYILGDFFTAADVYVASQIGWGLFTKTIEPRPAFTKYFEICAAREAAKRSDKKNQAFMK